MNAFVTALLTALCVIVLTTIAEYWHVKRWKPVARLTFGPNAAPRRWTKVVPAVRVLACGLSAWGFSILLLSEPDLVLTSNQTEESEIDPADVQRVILLLDVSPSMNIADAGSNQDSRRRDRVMEVVEGVLSRIALSRTRFSVVAFFTSARPVVVDATDTQVVRNILDNLPLVWSFEPGETNLLEGLRVAGELAAKWPPQSTTLFLCTDGDTVDFSQVEPLPRSIHDVEILAVGDPLVGTFLGGHNSRQNAAVLRRLAAELGGNYHDVNRRHMPSTALADLARIPPPPPRQNLNLKDLARLAVGLGAIILALLPFALQLLGAAWNPQRELPNRSSDVETLTAGVGR